jgi:hypothetical protein
MNFTNKPRHVLPLALIGCALMSGPFAHAQNAPKTAEASVAEQSISLPYQSPIEGYQRYADSKIEAWRQSNQTVEQIGGWKAYAHEHGGSR